MAHHLVRPACHSFSVPVFLAPIFSISSSCSQTVRSFSSSSTACTKVARGNRDKSKKRGVSAIRSTGPRQPLAVSRLGPLPKPVSDPTEARAAFEINPDHGLWGFFNENKEAMIPPSEESSHGRSWSPLELSRKSWDDLHRLYWTCLKEANVVRTRNNERDRLRAGYGQFEAKSRLGNLNKTMFRIRQVLLRRHYAHFDARLLLEEKYLFQLFPDVFRESVPEELLASETSTSSNDLSATTSVILDRDSATAAALSGPSLGNGNNDQGTRTTQ